MDVREFDALLRETLEDRRMSRAEKRDLRDRLEDVSLDGKRRHVLRSRIFAIAKEACSDPEMVPLVDWLKDVTGILERAASGAPKPSVETSVHFSPGLAPLRAITSLLKDAESRADVCVFTITDDRIAGALEAAHEDGVRVRIIADDDKANDLGSDVQRLKDSGLEVRLDRSPYHMHHKFLVTDQAVLLTGSYNWTRSAANQNEENVLVTAEPALVAPYVAEFEDLWKRLA